jgi:hypothetical protein
LADGFGDAIVYGDYVVDRQGRVDGANDLLGGTGYGGRVERGADC